MGQVSDPYEDEEDLGITISGLPGEPPEGEDETTSDDEPSSEAEEERLLDEVVFDLDGWSYIQHDAATRLLVEKGVTHHWDDNRLFVTRDHEEQARAILDELGGLPEPLEPLDPDVDQVAYDLSEWDEDRLIALSEALEEAEVPFAWDDDDELFVYEEDEQMVDELIDQVSHPHELAAENDDGDAGGELMGELFVAADRLQHDPDDHETSVILIDLARVAARRGTPYGLAEKQWERLQERVSELSDLLKEIPIDENAVLAAARELRNAIRPYV